MPIPKLGTTLRVSGWLAGWWLLWRLPPPPVVETPNAPIRRTLTVIIPARNEEHSLPHLLQSLATQTSPPDELVVIDDHSSDRTAALATASGATVIAGAPLPGGWTGKTWACHQGAMAATGELLCFLDADVTLAPDALVRLRGAWPSAGGLVSVQPFHLTKRPYERLSAVCNIVELMGTGAFSTPPRRPQPMAFGPCLLIDRSAYEQVGGHAHPDVRRLVAEDIGLAVRCRAEGLAVATFAGRDVVAFRMYPDGPRQLAEGWTKMLAYGARHTSPQLVLGVGAWVTAGLLTTADSLAVLWDSAGPGHRRRRAALGYAAWAVQLRWMLRRVGRFGWSPVALWPVPLTAFVALFGRSAVMRALGRAPQWRGRSTPPQ